MHAGEAYHRAFHRLFTDVPCSGDPAGACAFLLTPCEPDIRWLLEDWRRTYFRTFDAGHDTPLAWRAAAYLRRHMTDRLDVNRIVDEVGCGRTTLLRQFRRTFGCSMGDYLTRIRIRQAIVDLRADESKVESVALLVGYRSPKNLHARLAAAIGLTPSEIRALCQSDADRLLEVTLALPTPRRRENVSQAVWVR